METNINELIPITENNGKRAVSARELHAFVEMETRFDKWIKRMLEYGFVENVDYQCLVKNVQMPNGGFKDALDDYALSLSCAKEISMIQKNEKGKIARQYFIACEEKANTFSKQLSTLDLLELAIKGMRENNQELQEVKRDVLELKAKTQTRPDEFTVAGYATLLGLSINLIQASKYGRIAKTMCKNKNIVPGKIPDPRFGNVHTYPETILKEIFQNPIN